MIHIYIYLALIFNLLLANNKINQLFYEANNHMVNQKYKKAIEVYEQIIDSGFKSSSIYYNLGNAYFRDNKIGYSIWAYLSSLNVNPRNEDAVYNLVIAKSRTKDRVELPKTFFLLDFYRQFKMRFTFNEFVIFSSFLILVFSLINLIIKLNFFKNSKVIYLNNFILFISIILNLIALDKHHEIKNKKRGVVISKQLDAYSGPNYGQNVVIFRLNEGTVFEIKKISNDWLEIIMLDGKKGWVLINSTRLVL